MLCLLNVNGLRAERIAFDAHHNKYISLRLFLLASFDNFQQSLDNLRRSVIMVVGSSQYHDNLEHAHQTATDGGPQIVKCMGRTI